MGETAAVGDFGEGGIPLPWGIFANGGNRKKKILP